MSAPRPDDGSLSPVARTDPGRGTGLARFDREFRAGSGAMTVMGSGAIGGKAAGLALMNELIERDVARRFAPEITVNIPTFAVLATDYFDLYMRENELYETALSTTRDDLIAHAFQRASLPTEVLGDLRSLVAQVHTPLAIRSSSMLEDAMFRPFAGVYRTKMIPNNQPDEDARFRKLVEAIKYVYASTFFHAAKAYLESTEHGLADEKMAVIIQEVVGSRYGERFYPDIAGVARSYNYYPSGRATGEDGVVELALGLGRTIVDDGVAWSYSPAFPRVSRPYKSISQLLDQSQRKFWAVNMGTPPAYDPIKETEYLVQPSLKDAEFDGTLKHIASTYRADDDAIVMGIRERGARLLDFAPILKADYIPLNDLVTRLLEVCREKIGCDSEIEFALTLDPRDAAVPRFGFLQVRPMVVSDELVELQSADLESANALVTCDMVLGNGLSRDIRDVVYVRPDTFAPGITSLIPPVLERLNRKLVGAGRPYLLIGFGRWGTTDPSCGIPVEFGQISGAKVIVEMTRPDMDFTLSQGSHFFHNVTSFKIFYFSIEHDHGRDIDWAWLEAQPRRDETEFVTHCELTGPLEVRVDGRRHRGMIRHE